MTHFDTRNIDQFYNRANKNFIQILYEYTKSLADKKKVARQIANWNEIFIITYILPLFHCFIAANLNLE